jgi:hypothetical protein
MFVVMHLVGHTMSLSSYLHITEADSLPGLHVPVKLEGGDPYTAPPLLLLACIWSEKEGCSGQ